MNMKNRTPLFLRAHTVSAQSNKAKVDYASRKNGTINSTPEPQWPDYALIFDTETTIDERQALNFGFYRFCRYGQSGTYICIEEGLFYADELRLASPEALAVVKQYIETRPAETPTGYPSDIKLLTRSEFIERVFWRALLNANALVVSFNLPFDLTRVAVDCCQARRRNEGWSLVMSKDEAPKTGTVRHNPFRPRIKITPKDSKAAFIRLTGVSIRSKKTGKRLKTYMRGRFLDLRTLGWALQNQSFTLEMATKRFNVPGKLAHEPSGQFTVEEIDYCRQDIRATVGLLNAIRTEFDLHPIDLFPDHAYSPASIAKAYLRQMNITPPLQKFDLGADILGAAMQAYYGGRAECRIRRTPVPVVYTDFLSEYPTVNTLMGLWPFLTAEKMDVVDATDEIRELLTSFTPKMAFDQQFWKKLTFYALIEPSGDIVPVRTAYNAETTNIGINPLTSEEPPWYAGPDVIPATLLTGRPVTIIRAFRVVAKGQQTGLSPVSLRGMLTIDPATDEFFKKVIEARAQTKADKSLPEEQREALSYFLKILANSGSYGLFVEVNPENKGAQERERVRVFSGQSHFLTTSSVVESWGTWYCPPLAALIPAGGRLLLALLEYCVTALGGTYLLCDTDSMAIVASERGGLVACAGGQYRLPDGREAIKAITWGEVRTIAKKFELLNPYDRNVVRGSILKIEDVNFNGKEQREIWGYAIAAKRYTILTRTGDSIQIENPKAHGLGYLYPPKRGYDLSIDAPIWIGEAWEWVLREELGLSQKQISWFELPAMMRFTVTTPQVLKVLQARQLDLSYCDRVKAYNFIQSPIISPVGGHPIGTDPSRFTLISPFSSDPTGWYKRSYVNVHDGTVHRLGQPGTRLPSQAEPKTYGDIVAQYRWHPEAKSLGPDGEPCGPRTHGLLRRTPVTAENTFRYIGKETDRRWEQGEDISILDAKPVEYTANETARLVCDVEVQRAAKAVTIRQLAKAAGVTENTVKSVRRGDRVQKSTVEKLKKGIRELMLRDVQFKKLSIIRDRRVPCARFGSEHLKQSYLEKADRVFLLASRR